MRMSSSAFDVAISDRPKLRREGVAIDARFYCVPKSQRCVRFGLPREMAGRASTESAWQRPYTCFLSAHTFGFRLLTECLPSAARDPSGEFDSWTPIFRVRDGYAEFAVQTMLA